MQDRFKFKAVLKTNKFAILVEPFYILENGYFIDINKAEIEFENKYPDECFWDFIEKVKKQDYIQEISIDSDFIITSDFTNLIQCTGLKDKNGKLIYEGDIIKELHSPTYSAVVHYNVERAAFKLRGKGYYTGALETIRNDYFEVIGSIYENPKLLKEEK